MATLFTRKRRMASDASERIRALEQHQDYITETLEHRIALMQTEIDRQRAEIKTLREAQTNGTE